ncbi:hypothetical protein BH23ACT2_BH23ACT2_13500 [soil metagenome]
MHGAADNGHLVEDVTDLLVAVGEAAQERASGVLLAIDDFLRREGAQLASPERR